jgi:hypothetical protein
MFVDSVRGYKPRYYAVRAESGAARESLYRDVTVTVGGEQVVRREPKFPLAWTFAHYEHSTDFYLTKDRGMSEQDWASLKILNDYVSSFKLGPCVYKEVIDGERVTLPVLDKAGKQEYDVRIINTRAVLSAKSAAARKILLGIRGYLVFFPHF